MEIKENTTKTLFWEICYVPEYLCSKGTVCQNGQSGFLHLQNIVWNDWLEFTTATGNSKTASESPPHTPIYLKFAATLSDTVGEEHLA